MVSDLFVTQLQHTQHIHSTSSIESCVTMFLRFSVFKTIKSKIRHAFNSNSMVEIAIKRKRRLYRNGSGKIVAKSARQSERYLLSEKSTCHHAKTGSEKWYAWADVRLLLIRHLVRSPAWGVCISCCQSIHFIYRMTASNYFIFEQPIGTNAKTRSYTQNGKIARAINHKTLSVQYRFSKS